MDLQIDFVDPGIGFSKGNIILAARQTLTLRDRVSLAELDTIFAYLKAQRAADPAVNMAFVEQGRWQLVP